MVSADLVFQRGDFLETCAKAFDLKFDGRLFVRKGITASNICPLVPYGQIPDVFEYPKVSIVTPPYLGIPRYLSSWRSEVLYTNILNTKTYALNKSGMKSVKKALKDGFYVEPSEDIGSFHAIYQKMYDTQGLEATVTETQMKILYSFIRSHDIGELLAVKTPDGTMVGGSVQLYDAQYGHNWLNSTLGDYLKTGANYLLYKEAIERIKDRGIDRFDMRMGNIERLDRFAQNFGPERVPYYRLVKPVSVSISTINSVIHCFVQPIMVR